ncbi:hypothetical protein HMPREF1051_2531 [Neisseria sicca VK64]|uniref:Uncharacterized protein n=1 Tax=Neisseria sicca VK64 TaxID=1095748 RepID=I2NFC4_NEISI|nr:hypothetical protein HMPREF1051_2531 [Neisseria sicca VK64]
MQNFQYFHLDSKSRSSERFRRPSTSGFIRVSVLFRLK